MSGPRRSRVRGSGTLAGLLVLSLNACSRELGPLAAENSAPRPEPRWEVRHSNGDGSVAGVIDATVAALQEDRYRCYVTGGPLRGGRVVAHRHYSVGSDDAVTEIEILTVNGELFTRSVEYRDGAAQRRHLHDSKDRPMAGADTVASRIFAAAAGAPCPATSQPREPPVEPRSSDGDGSVEWVMDGVLAALQEGAYRCVARVSPLRSGDTLAVRFYHIGSGDAATTVSFTVNARDRRQAVSYTDRSGQHRYVGEREGRRLVGADSLASRIFAAAAAAPCPN